MNTQDTTYALEAGAEGFFASDIEIEDVKNTQHGSRLTAQLSTESGPSKDAFQGCVSRGDAELERKIPYPQFSDVLRKKASRGRGRGWESPVLASV